MYGVLGQFIRDGELSGTERILSVKGRYIHVARLVLNIQCKRPPSLLYMCTLYSECIRTLHVLYHCMIIGTYVPRASTVDLSISKIRLDAHTNGLPSHASHVPAALLLLLFFALRDQTS